MIGILEDVAEVALESTKFFHSGAEPSSFLINTGAECVECLQRPRADKFDRSSEPYRSTPLLQSGVTRTNCIGMCLPSTWKMLTDCTRLSRVRNFHACSSRSPLTGPVAPTPPSL